MGAPASGEKRRLVFDGRSIPATLRRLGNARGHVQVKYENQAGEPFRNWLVSTFATKPDTSSGDYFELSRIGEDQYEVRPFPLQETLFPHSEGRLVALSPRTGSSNATAQ